MRKFLFSAIAVSCAIAGIAATKARTSNFVFKPALTAGQPTAATLTTTANWTIASVLCTGTSVVCNVTPPSAANITTTAQLTQAIRDNNGVIPTSYTVVKKAYATH